MTGLLVAMTLQVAGQLPNVLPIPASANVMTYKMPSLVAALVPATILDRVQNGLDTAFSEAMDSDGSSKWRATYKNGTKDKPAAVKVANTLKRKWEVQADHPGLFLLFSIGIENLVRDCGEFSIGLPDFAVTWFVKLESKVKAETKEQASQA